MNIEQIEQRVATKVLEVVAPYGFSGPHIRKVSEMLHVVYFSRENLGISVELDLRDGGLLPLTYVGALSEGFVQSYRDTRDRIQKRFVKEILTSVGLMSPEEAKEHKEFYRSASRDLEKNAEVLIRDAAAIIARAMPYLLGHQAELFGMTQIVGAPANFYR